MSLTASSVVTSNSWQTRSRTSCRVSRSSACASSFIFLFTNCSTLVCDLRILDISGFLTAEERFVIFSLCPKKWRIEWLVFEIRPAPIVINCPDLLLELGISRIKLARWCCKKLKINWRIFRKSQIRVQHVESPEHFIRYRVLALPIFIVGVA